MTTSVRQARRPSTTPQRRTARGRTVPGWAVAVAGVLGAVVITAVVLLTAGHRDAAAGTPAPLAPPPTAVVAEINGQDIPVREFTLYLAQERAATFAHFRQAYGVSDGPDFWTTPHGGTTPAAYARKLALADVTRAAVVLGLAQRHGLIADPGYDAFLTSWTAENARRRDAVAAHQVVYGPVQYTEANYLNYVLHDLDARLETKLTRSGDITVPDRLKGQDRQAYVHERYRSMTAKLARSARTRVARAVYDAVPVN
ncbi:hypothetical protein [Streptomyces cylindrosporus]|uniref:Uncharacterized protein n=1 Tax=Streptomyces cylindrosporus TaxID=2927583 RepID=A0ABS9YM71_9ACTN|nr:hypothetical protein [Streptomyces cylindrosporus]MCI3278368.1 hypothetical protein [Streptomyces cylindrosporus]